MWVKLVVTLKSWLVAVLFIISAEDQKSMTGPEVCTKLVVNSEASPRLPTLDCCNLCLVPLLMLSG